MKGWSGRRPFTALPAVVDVRPNGWPRFEPHFVWEFWNIQCSRLLVVEEATQVDMPFPERFRFSSCYCSALAIIGEA